VIDDLDRSFRPGALTVITGRSGAGKTTLLRLIAGLDRPDRGDVLIDGVSLAARSPEERAALRRERIGYMPQEPTPVRFLSAAENVVLALRIRGWSRTDASARAAVVLAGVGLAERERQLVSRLSAGEAQRVALARALAAARGLLIVDEPTSRLDEISARALAAQLSSAAREAGQTVICASHDPELIACADELVELRRQPAAA
jgi:ABC-type lipoprotein export system ATPase subunit